MRFTIITYIEHRKKGNSYFSYAPYIREMNIWLKQVEEVEVVAPLLQQEHLLSELSYEHENLNFTRIPSFDLLSMKAAFYALFRIPGIGLTIWKAMKRSNHIHLRCPGNIGLLACILQIFFPKVPKTTKYAGNWDPQAKQPWTYNLQKWILSNSFLTRNMQVLVYGEWPGQSKNVRLFFTASFSEKDKKEVEERSFEGPLIFLFVGNLVSGKHPLKAIQLVQELQRNPQLSEEAPELLLEIYGNGPEMKTLETYCRKEKLEGLVKFRGNSPLEELKEAYQKAHLVILPSQSEGWPKALAEGMFFGCIPIATPVSCVPWMLGSGSRGILLTEQAKGQRLKVNSSKEWSVVSGQWSEDIIKINELLADPKRMKKMSEAAKDWSQQYTLEKFEAAIKEVLQESKKGSSPFGRGGGVG